MMMMMMMMKMMMMMMMLMMCPMKAIGQTGAGSNICGHTGHGRIPLDHNWFPKRRSEGYLTRSWRARNNGP